MFHSPPGFFPILPFILRADSGVPSLGFYEGFFLGFPFCAAQRFLLRSSAHFRRSSNSSSRASGLSLLESSHPREQAPGGAAPGGGGRRPFFPSAVAFPPPCVFYLLKRSRVSQISVAHHNTRPLRVPQLLFLDAKRSPPAEYISFTEQRPPVSSVLFSFSPRA